MAIEPFEICILAAGMGTRMRSTRPKVLQLLAGRPLLSHLLDTVSDLEPSSIHVVIGQEADQIMSACPDIDNVHWVIQAERLGTGHAVMQAAPDLASGSRVVILLGDAPLISQATIRALLALRCDLGILSVDMDDPFNYGRIIRDGNRGVTAIVEERDASDEERLIREINTGCMVADADKLRGWLKKLDRDNDQGEYLLTDIVSIAADEGARVVAHKASDVMEVTGINNFEQLAALERNYQLREAKRLMAEGVHIVDPARFDSRGRIEAGRDVRIDVNVILEGEVILGDGVEIGSNCVIRNCTIGARTRIHPNTVMEDATIDEDCKVGPFARIRPGTRLENTVAVGNFVEVKKSTLGEGSKASHLAYLGDSTIGSGVNIGAGTITCNYDGVNKFQTRIGDNVFVGSNSSLVAPVTIGEGSTIGAGSTITKDVEPDVLALGRGRQTIISNWKKPVRKQ